MNKTRNTSTPIHDKVYKTYAVAEREDGSFFVMEIGSNVSGSLAYTCAHGVYEDYESALLEAVKLGRINSMYGL